MRCQTASHTALRGSSAHCIPLLRAPGIAVAHKDHGHTFLSPWPRSARWEKDSPRTCARGRRRSPPLHYKSGMLLAPLVQFCVHCRPCSTSGIHIDYLLRYRFCSRSCMLLLNSIIRSIVHYFTFPYPKSKFITNFVQPFFVVKGFFE